MSNIPDWWTFLLLGAASYRVWRLLAADKVLAVPREWLVRRDGPSYRHRAGVEEFLRCPWCMGFYVVLAWWASWLVWSHGTVVVAVPWALSLFVGLIQRNYDP